MSVSQLTGFFLANLCGMVIVLLSVQFYSDVLPAFTEGDSFLKKDYIIVSKRVSTLGSAVGRSTGFTKDEVSDLKAQPFTEQVGEFRPAQFKVSAGMGLEGMQLSTAMFFESVPDAFVDVKSDDWHYTPGMHEIPIIIPRNYLNLYNFGFAQSRNMPQISEGMMGMLPLDIRLRGKGQSARMQGRIVGFSDRLNTILVPESFLEWANRQYGEDVKEAPSRLILEVKNPADDRIAKYFKDKGYETENDKLDAGKTTWFLKVIVGIVLSVGLLISVLSFYLLMLSIYLLLQKNTTKLENLLLIGYSPARVAAPYQILTATLNAFVFFLAMVAVVLVRNAYLDRLTQLFPSLETGSVWPACVAGSILFIVVSLLNIFAIRKKVDKIWLHR